jgi:spore coat polysaccharide biosynthesis protein SpsF
MQQVILMNNIGVVILVRYNSARLYGKALLNINGKPSLKYLIERLETLFNKNQLIIATSKENHDDPIENFSMVNNIKCYRGSLNNVSERFKDAAKLLKKKYIVRITGDSIFLDMNLLKEIILQIDEKHLLFSNRISKTYPVGQTIDIVDLEKYIKYFQLFSTKSDFEHVTSYFFENKSNFRIKNISNKLGTFRSYSLGLDNKKDYENAISFIKNFKNYSSSTSYLDIYNYYDKIKKNL